ncbi:MAG: thioredoxin domain-containing protein [Candidatus Sulfotelmatobacter sp.]
MKRRVATLVWLLLLARTFLGQSSGAGSAKPASSAIRRVEVVEFADFQCPFCAKQASDLHRLQAEYPDVLTVTFKNFPLSAHKQSQRAHLAALAAGKQGKFWAMHDLIYSHPAHLSAEDFDRYAIELDLDKDEFRESLSDPAYLGVIEKDVKEGKALGVEATPTFFINGHKLVGRQSHGRLKEVVEAELNGQPWQPTGPIRVDLNGAPSRGKETAPVTIVEFSDFQCPFCAGAVIPLQRLLAANEGKVRFVFKNFPLAIHADSRLAHMAALAAGEQGEFWEMHDLIFAHQHTIKRADLMDFAAQLQLDMSKFQKDIESPQMAARIENDKSEGERLGIAGTPSFVVNGEIVAGFFAEKIQAEIDGQGTHIQQQTAALPAELPPLNLSSGPKDAPLKIRWYVDLSSPLTAKSAVALQQFVSSHHGNVLVEFKNFPLQNHSTAMLVHEFALAAAAQGKFWPVESLLLADPKSKDREELKNVAKQAQLDEEKLWAEVDSHKYASAISRDLMEANALGVSGTPTFVVGDQKFDGVNGLSTLP